MSDVKSLFRKKKKADGKPRTEAFKRATQEAAEDDDVSILLRFMLSSCRFSLC